MKKKSLCFLVILVLILCGITYCGFNKYKKCHKDKQVSDSLVHDKYYQDSIRLEIEKHDQDFESKSILVETHTLVIIGVWNDSIKNRYHTSTKCYHLNKFNKIYNNIEKFKLTSEIEAINMGYKYCNECDEIENVYSDYLDGQLVENDDILYDY